MILIGRTLAILIGVPLSIAGALLMAFALVYFLFTVYTGVIHDETLVVVFWTVVIYLVGFAPFAIGAMLLNAQRFYGKPRWG